MSQQWLLARFIAGFACLIAGWFAASHTGRIGLRDAAAIVLIFAGIALLFVLKW